MGNTLRPLPGFNWMQVSWGAPDEVRTVRCSYCDSPLGDPEDEDRDIPLILWNEADWCAEFCTACQRRWWGFEDDDEC